MSFHEVRFPANLSLGAIGGPERRTEVVTLANGFEERNTPWAHSRRRYDAGMALRSLDDVEDLVTFFEARQGQLFGFRWKDWGDYKSSRPSQNVSSADQIIMTGDGVTLTAQLSKTYASGPQSYQRIIKKPVAGSVLVSVDGADLQDGLDFTVDTASGVVTLTQPPGPGLTVRAGFEFDVPVRFDSDRIATAIANFQAGQAPSVPVVEVRL